MANVTLNSEKWKSFPLNSRTRSSSSPLFSNTVLEIPATAIRQRKEIKYINTGREEVKLSLHTNDIIVYIEAHKDSTKKLLEFINSARYQETRLTYINLFHFFTLTMKYQKQNKKKKTLKIKPQNIKYLGINITSKVKTMLRTTRH